MNNAFASMFVARFLAGALIFAGALALWFQDIIEKHPFIFFISAHIYAFLVIFGAYKKYQAIVYSERAKHIDVEQGC